jgi:hypothetical protein
MAYKNKTYIAFDGDTDMHYYHTLQMWKERKDIDFDYYDAHDLNNAWDSSLTESIKRQLRVRFDNSKLFMILVGESTKRNRKFIPWEIEQALSRNLPIIVVNINGKRRIDSNLCPSSLHDKLAIHVAFKSKIIQYAIENWPYCHDVYRLQGKTNDYYYTDETYRNLGL